MTTSEYLYIPDDDSEFGQSHTGFYVDLEQTAGWERDAETYDSHGGAYCPEDSDGYDSESKLCKACEYIHDTADQAESVLVDLGYVTIWGDGVHVFRVAEDDDDGTSGQDRESYSDDQDRDSYTVDES